MNKILLTVITTFLITTTCFGQLGKIQGLVTDAYSSVPIPSATVILQGTNMGVTSDSLGKFMINNIKPGVYNITISSKGYETQTISEVSVNTTKTSEVNFELSQEQIQLKEVNIAAKRFEKIEESPLSKFSIRSSEIMRNPGGNRDISKVLQSFPGVASTVSFRNDIIIRGGAPNENRFYLDGIETPNINHFATQGSSGGPVGMINVNFINQVEFYSGAFPASRGNSLSSVLEFKQKNGNPDRLVTNLMLGSSDIGLTMDGPLNEKSDFIFSIRRSYLQFLFSALKLPFLPTYNDAQFKINYRIDSKNTLTLIGLAAIDQFQLNTKVNDGVTDSTIIDRNNYILGYIPANEQWNYTLGVKYTHVLKNGFRNIILSRNMLNNTSKKYQNNITSNPVGLLLDYQSQESENKLRIEYQQRINGFKLSYGAQYEYALYSTSTYNKTYIPTGITEFNYASRLGMHKAGAFAQVSKSVLKERLVLSAGIRTDINNYSKEMSNPLQQVSPRFSASYRISNQLTANFNTGIYYQLPAYTVLGYRDENGNLLNKDNEVRYIQCNHVVGGFEFLPDQNTKISIESFYKKYSHYPFLMQQQVSLANLGSDFGVIGNAPVRSVSEGRSYGLEFFAQRTLKKGWYGIVSYTYSRSEFTNLGNNYTVSSWDNRHILTMTAGRQFRKHWEFGMKFRYLSGAPYTPYDYNASALKAVWNVSHQGVYDYTQINTLRLDVSHQLDIRVDKKFYFGSKTLDVYIDIQNLYGHKTTLQPYLTVETDATNQPIEDPQNASKYLMKTIKNETGTVLPSIGMMFEF